METIMRNQFLEDLAQIQDYIQEIYNHYEILYGKDKSHKIIDLHNGFVLRIRESSILNSKDKTLVSSIDEKNGLNDIIVFEQSNQNKNIGQIKLSKTDKFSFINQKEFEQIFNEKEVRKTVLLESEKLKQKLDYDFSKDFPERMIYSLPDDRCAFYVSKIKDSVELKINFPKSQKNSSSNFEASYDFRKIKEIFKIFDNKEFDCAFYKITQADKVNETFLDFYKKVKDIDSSIFKEEIKTSINEFKNDMEVIQSITATLSFTHNAKKLKI